MTYDRKMELLANAMDIDPEKLSPDMVLADLEEWDSIARISFVAVLGDEFNKTVSGADIKAKETVGDLLTLMELE